MKINVVIPAYNASATIEATLNSVLSQTIAPDEILIMDDGSTDNTLHLLEPYKPRVTVFRQDNSGCDHARNILCKRAKGDLIAFLDADDSWHPMYLEVQVKLFRDYPNAVAFFTENESFFGYGNYHWKTGYRDLHIKSEWINPVSFIKRYNKTPMSFQLSGCCIPKKVLAEIGSEPFSNSRGSGDTYLHSLIPLLGSIVHTPVPLVAYRIINSSISSNQLKSSLLVVKHFQLLQERYNKTDNSALYDAFKMVFASRMRTCGKFLMGAGRFQEARRQFWYSISKTRNPVSIAKSLSLFFLSYMPGALQPKWPSSDRALKSPDHISTGDESHRAI